MEPKHVAKCIQLQSVLKYKGRNSTLMNFNAILYQLQSVPKSVAVYIISS